MAAIPFSYISLVNASFTTTFSLTESPISESGNWASRSSSRTLVNTAGGISFGTQTGSGGFDDSYAYLVGSWSADTEAIATVFKGTTTGIQEVEFLFRLTDTLGGPNVTCYEINIAQDGQYANCYAWQGPKTDLSQFREITTSSISGGVNNGYKFKARCQGNTLSLWVDRIDGNGWVPIFSVNDTGGGGGGAQYLTGNPGIGFYREAASGAANQFGWTDYTVSSL